MIAMNFVQEQLKKHDRASAEVQFKKLFTKNKINPNITVNIFQKVCRKNTIKECENTAKREVKMPHANKKSQLRKRL